MTDTPDEDETFISRGAMTLEHHIRRQDRIDAEFLAGEIDEPKWRAETKWLNEGIAALRDAPPHTKRRQVLPPTAVQ
jgi:hypothetical protein